MHERFLIHIESAASVNFLLVSNAFFAVASHVLALFLFDFLSAASNVYVRVACHQA